MWSVPVSSSGSIMMQVPIERLRSVILGHYFVKMTDMFEQYRSSPFPASVTYGVWLLSSVFSGARV